MTPDEDEDAIAAMILLLFVLIPLVALGQCAVLTSHP